MRGGDSLGICKSNHKAQMVPRDKAGRGDVTTSISLRVGRAAGLAGYMALALAAGGCGMSSMMPSGGLFGGQSAETTGTTALTEETMLAAAKVGEGSPASLEAAAQTCPQIVVWPNDQYLTVYEQGREGDGLAVMHRGEITKTARECEIAPGRITVKYGFSGRVLLGPRGQPGEVQLPVYLSVTDSARQKVTSADGRVAVSISQAAPIGYFSAVQSVTFDIPEGKRPGDYMLYVGFAKLPVGKTADKKKLKAQG